MVTAQERRPGIRVLTYNVYAPANPEWDRRRPLIARTVRALDADILALQEVPLRDGGAFVDSLAGAGFHLAELGEPDAAGVGGVLASRWPLRDVQRLDLALPEHPPSIPWIAAVLAEVETPVGVLTVAHHKPSWEFGREADRLAQAARLVAALESRENERGAVVLGDLDATPDSASLRYLRGLDPHDGHSTYLQDCWQSVHGDEPGVTFSSENPLVRGGQVATALSRRIDYVLVSGGVHGPALEVDDCFRLLEEPVDGVWASDHAGVVADLVLPDHDPGTHA